MKICITGGSGFVGSQLAKSFVDAGHTVLILDLRSPRDEIAGVDFRKSCWRKHLW
jgi:nucleoside-diphosphate-sugar epimerase